MNKNRRFNIPDVLSVFIIFAAVTLFYSEIIFTDKIYFIGDIYSQFYPWKHFLKESLASGITPFWNPFVFSGVPFIADVQKGAFYPPGILFIFLDFADAFRLYIIVHYFFMGLSSFLLLREFKFSSTASVAGTFVLLFNSYTVSQLNFLSSLGSLSIMPAIMLVFTRMLKHSKIILWAALAVLLSMSFLAGHPTTLYYTLLFLFSYLLFHTAKNYTPGPSARHRLPLTSIFFIIAAILTAALLCMPQSGLFTGYIKESARIAGLNYASAAENSMPFSGLLGFFMPGGINGININPLVSWIHYSLGSIAFFSATFIFLFFISLFLPPSGLKKFSFIMILFSLLLALGENTPFHGWFFSFVPFYNTLRHPGFALSMTIIPASIITAYSIDHIKAGTPVQPTLFDRLSPVKKITNYFTYRFSGRLLRLYGIMILILVLISANYRTVSEVYSLSGSGLLKFIYGYIVFLFIFGLNILFHSLKSHKFLRASFYSALIAASIFIEFFIFVSGINPAIEQSVYSKESLGLKTPGAVRTSVYKQMHTPATLHHRLYKGSSLFEAQRNYLLSLPPNTPMLYNLHDAGGYDAIKLKNYSDFTGSALSFDAPLDREKLRILNVKYLFTLSAFEDRGFDLIYEGDFKIYKNRDALPVFFLTRHRDVLDLIFSQSSWTRKNEYDFSSYSVEVNAGEEGYLVFSSSYFPGWQVYVDNRAAVIEKCFGIYKGVKLSRGTHSVTFIYTPENLRLFLFLGILASGLLIISGILYIAVILKRRHV